MAGISVLLAGAQAAHAQLRIVQYNTGALKTGQTTVLQQIGNEQVGVNGIAKPIDILVVQEQGTSNTATAIASLNTIRDALNGIYGANTYATVAYPEGATSTGGGLPGMIIRSASVDVVATAAIGSVGFNPLQPRSTIRYQLRPDGYDSAADFYVYASHMKASDDAEGRTRREAEVAAIRANC